MKFGRSVTPTKNEAGNATIKPISKGKKVRKQKGCVKLSEDKRSSLAIIEFMFDSVPSDNMVKVRNALYSIFIKLQPQLFKAIISHGAEQLRLHPHRSHYDVDWSSLHAQDTVCQAIWDFHVKQLILQN